MAIAKNFKTKTALGVVTLSLLTSACSGVRGELEESGQVPEADSQVELAFEGDVDTGDLEGVQVNFAFKAPDLYTDGFIDGAELYAEAPLIMVFTVPSCDVCHVEGPKIATAAELHPEINYVMVHSFGTTDEYIAFIDEAGLVQENVFHMVDTEGVLWERFGVTSQPSSILVDVDGEIVTSRGALGDDGLARAAARVTQLPVLDHNLFDGDSGTDPDNGGEPTADPDAPAGDTDPGPDEGTETDSGAETAGGTDGGSDANTDVDPENDGIDSEEADTGGSEEADGDT